MRRFLLVAVLPILLITSCGINPSPSFSSSSEVSHSSEKSNSSSEQSSATSESSTPSSQSSSVTPSSSTNLSSSVAPSSSSQPQEEIDEDAKYKVTEQEWNNALRTTSSFLSNLRLTTTINGELYAQQYLNNCKKYGLSGDGITRGYYWFDPKDIEEDESGNFSANGFVIYNQVDSTTKEELWVEEACSFSWSNIVDDYNNFIYNSESHSYIFCKGDDIIEYFFEDKLLKSHINISGNSILKNDYDMYGEVDDIAIPNVVNGKPVFPDNPLYKFTVNSQQLKKATDIFGFDSLKVECETGNDDEKLILLRNGNIEYGHYVNAKYNDYYLEFIDGTTNRYNFIDGVWKVEHIPYLITGGLKALCGWCSLLEPWSDISLLTFDEQTKSYYIITQYGEWRCYFENGFLVKHETTFSKDEYITLLFSDYDQVPEIKLPVIE